MSYFRDHAVSCLRNGYGIVAVQPRLKRPYGQYPWADHGWTLPTEDWIAEVIHDHPDAGLGVANGRYTVAFDFDTGSEADNKRYLAMASEICGVTPLQRVGQAPKIAALYRAQEPIISTRLPQMDALGLMTQLIAYGVHPETRSPYRWVGEGAPHDTPVSDLPAVSNDQVITLMSEIAREIYGNRFQQFQLDIDRNFLPLVMTSRSFLMKQLWRRLFRGKAYARKQALNTTSQRIPSGCWGLVMSPILDPVEKN